MALVVVVGIGTAAVSSGELGASTCRAPAHAVVVHDQQPGTPFDRRLLGTNLPAWVGPARLADPAFIAATVASGTTVIRMPGGSWSDAYDWLACENQTAGCLWDGAARPQDYVGFLDGDGDAGMWTVNVNGTAQSAAALVAYFNGAVDDTRPIGDGSRTASTGRPWATWARLRVEHGHRAPADVRLWEIGNEVCGAKPAARGRVRPVRLGGRMDVRRPRATSHGDDDHDGFLAVRAAMRAVDPDIAVGAVGVDRPEQLGQLGQRGARRLRPVSSTSTSSTSTASIAGTAPVRGAAGRRPGLAGMPPARCSVRSSSADPGRDVPVADHRVQPGREPGPGRRCADDHRRSTPCTSPTRSARWPCNGVRLANQWNLINGKAENGTDYGMLDAASRAAPQYAGLALWSATSATPSCPSTVVTTTSGVYASTSRTRRERRPSSCW